MDGFHSLWGLGQCENANPLFNVGECHVTPSTEACWVPVSWDYTDCLSVKPSALLPTFKEQKTLNLSQKLEKFGALGFLPQMEHRIGWCWEAACISLLGLPWPSPQTEWLQWQNFIFSRFSRLYIWARCQQDGFSKASILRLPSQWWARSPCIFTESSLCTCLRSDLLCLYRPQSPWMGTHPTDLLIEYHF